MRTISAAVCVVSAAVIILTGCDQSGSGGSGLAPLLLMSSNDSVADMSQSSLEALTDGMSDVNNSGTINVSYRSISPDLRERLAIAEGMIMKAASAEAATASCPGGGTYTVTDVTGTWNNSSADAFYVTRTFNDCAGPYDLVSVSGNSVLYWADMKTGVTGTAKLESGSTLEQAPVNKRFTRVLTGDYVTVDGNGGVLSNGDLSGNIAHTINWTAVGATTRSFTMATDLTRRGYRSSGTQVFEHRITTPSPLGVTVDMSAGTRTVSGSVKVEHVLLGTTVTTTFASLVIPIADCVPSSGSATIVITGGGNGNGTITYNGDGTANYTYTFTNRRGRTRSGSGTFTVSGCQ
jgi:hypothetical protein